MSHSQKRQIGEATQTEERQTLTDTANGGNPFVSVHSVCVSLTLYYPLLAMWSDEAKTGYCFVYARIAQRVLR